MEICIEDVWTEERIKGAVGSLNFCIEHKHIGEDLKLIAGDNYFEFDLSEFMASHNDKNTPAGVYDIGDKSKVSQA